MRSGECDVSGCRCRGRPGPLGDVVCRRSPDGDPQVEGVAHLWIWHSPGGLEWGYGGSGPADLALNILLAATRDHRFAGAHHQDFKRAMVEALPREGGTIRAGLILEWISARRTAQASRLGNPGSGHNHLR